MKHTKRKPVSGLEKMKEEIVESLSLFHLTKVQQEKVLALLLKATLLRLQVAILKNLSREDREKLRAMGKKASGKKVLQFVEARIEDFPGLADRVARETIGEFRKESAGR